VEERVWAKGGEITYQSKSRDFALNSGTCKRESMFEGKKERHAQVKIRGGHGSTWVTGVGMRS